jgi:hypothetical protein
MEDFARRQPTPPCPYVTGTVTRFCTLTPFTLTDAEREAIALAKSRLGTSDGDWQADDVLAALLERLG